MSTNTYPSTPCFHDTLKALGTFARLHCAEKQGNMNACPCYPLVKFFLDHLSVLFQHWSSETQCHGSPSAIADECNSCGDFAVPITGIVEVPSTLDVGTPSFSGPFPMEFDFTHQSLPNTTLDPDNGTHAPCLSGPVHLEDSNLNPELSPEFKYSEGLLSEFFPMGYASPQMWSPYDLPQPSDASSSNGSLSYDCPWANQYAHDDLTEPLPYDTRPCAQNSNDVYLSSLFGGTDFHLPTSSWSEERERMDNTDSTSSLCRWGGVSCSSPLTFDKSEVGKHLQVKHGVKSGGDKEKMTCSWDGCGKEMNKESISRHIVAVHLSNKPEYCSCGKQFARLDSKLRHRKNSKRGECRESEDHDSSRAKRRRLSWP